MKKKLLTLLLVLVLGCMGLVGCGGNGDSKQNDESASGGKTELTWWMTYSDNGVDALKTLVEKFNAESDSYHLTMEYGGETSSVRQKLNTMSKEDYPSLICGSPDVLSDYADASYIADLQTYLDADSEDWENDIYTGIRNTYSDLEGNLVGGMLGISAKGWIVNVTMLEQAGYKVEDITSMEKVAEIALAAKNKGLCTYGYTPYSGNEITMTYLMRGVPFIYQGQEIGMINSHHDSIEEFDDVESINMYQSLCENMTPEEALKKINFGGRDNQRRPMCWSGEETAGFSTGRPWIPLHSHYRDINLKLDLASDKSVYRFYRDLLELRTNSEVIRVGDFKVLSEPNASYCAYTRTEGKDEILVICNFEEESRISFPHTYEQLLLSNYGHSQKVDDIFKPYEIAVFKIKKFVR